MEFVKRVLQVVALLCFIVPHVVSAHATPISYTPLAGSTELTTPASISIRFTERIEVGASSLSVYGPDSTPVNVGQGNIDAEDNRILSVPIEDGKEGVYTVSWQVVSVDDGHFTKGAYSFLVDQTGAVYEGHQGGVDVSYSSKLPDAYLGFMQLIGESVCIGVLGFIFLALYMSSRKKLVADEDVVRIDAVLFDLVTFGGLLFTVSTLLVFLRKSAELATLQSTPLLDAGLVYVQSSVGTFSALKFIGALMFILLCVVYRKRVLRMPMPDLTALCAVLFCILAMQAYVSHAAASFFYPMISVLVTFIHLVAKELIAGGLFVVLVLMIVLMNTHKNLLVRCVRYYDMAAACALLLAVVSGAYITWLHLKNASNLVHTQWGELFLILIMCTVALGVLRIFHQFMVSPNLDTRPNMYRIFMVTLGIEAGLACFVLFFSGYIAITTPPFTVEAYTYKEIVEQSGITTTLTVHPYEVGSMLVEFTKSHTEEPLVPKAVIITSENVTADIGPNVLSVEKRFDGGYVFPRNELSPSGAWKLHVVAQQEKGYDVNASFDIEYPSEVDITKVTDDVRRFDDFALIVLCIGLFGTLFALVMTMAAFKAVRSTVKLSTAEEVRVSVSKALMIAVLLICCIAGLLALCWSLFGESDLKKMCERDGYQFVQSFPTRDFEATSPNAQNGCLVHEGHFHIVDEREYATWRKEWK